MLTKVEYEKDGFRITDAAMNDLLRPALYNAHHDVWPLVESNKQTPEVNLVGPICETGDFLAKNINISASQDDLLAPKGHLVMLKYLYSLLRNHLFRI